MSVQSFWDSSPADVYAFVEQARAVRETDQREWYEIARWVSRFILTPHSKRPLRLQEIAKFPWEKSAIAGPPSKEELAKWDAIDKKYGIPTVDKIKKQRQKGNIVDLKKLARKRKNG